jgi:molecular chaperone HtpG
VDLDSDADKAVHDEERREQEKDFAELLDWLKETLSDHIKDVRLSTRLTQSPACLITDSFGMTPALARMYRASGQAVPVGKRILELNPKHPLVTGLQAVQKKSGDEAQSQRLAETAELLYGTALLAEGEVPEDPGKFAGLLADRLVHAL